MVAFTPASEHKRLCALLGVSLCALLLFFALSAKVAPYRHNQRALATITASKMWQKNTPHISQAEAVQTAFRLPVLFTFLLAPVLISVWNAVSISSAPRKDLWLAPAVFVRPPPSI